MVNADKVRFVLVNTTHPGNIGATARAIKNMGFSELYLVCPHQYPHPEAINRSSGAEDILDHSIVLSKLQDAVGDCNLIIGTSARQRALPIPLLTPREAASATSETIKQGGHVAILFGQERMGLTNEELASCHYHLSIPCNPDFASLNLAAAVQIVAYELRLVLEDAAPFPLTHEPTKVTGDDMEKFYEHLEKTLIEIQFLDPINPRQMMRKLRRLFNRVSLEQNEMNILRGILSEINKRVPH